MKRVLFGHGHKMGDIFIGVSSFDILRQFYPDRALFININKNYQSAAPLFYNQKSIDGIFISDEADLFPSDLDRQNLKELQFSEIFNPNQPHVDGHDWFLRRHQVSDIAFSYGMPACDKKLSLNKWFAPTVFEKTIAFQPFPAFYAPDNDKGHTIERAQGIVDMINGFGYSVLQVGGGDEPKLKNTVKFNTDIFNSVKNILGCRAFIGYDSGLTWILSCYDFPVLAMYSENRYMFGGKSYIKNIQPINPNAIYLNSRFARDISLDTIEEQLKSLT